VNRRERKRLVEKVSQGRIENGQKADLTRAVWEGPEREAERKVKTFVAERDRAAGPG